MLDGVSGKEGSSSITFQRQEQVGFPDSSVVKNLPANAGDVDSIPPKVGKIPWRRKQQHILVFSSEEFHGQRSLAGYRPWDRRRVRHDLATRQQRQEQASMLRTNSQKQQPTPEFLPGKYHGQRSLVGSQRVGHD